MKKDVTFIHSSVKSKMQFRDFRNQKKVLNEFLRNYTATASMVSVATGIPQKNICRLKRQMEKAGLLWEIRKAPCKVTGFKAWYLTTDPEKAPYQQPKLF